MNSRINQSSVTQVKPLHLQEEALSELRKAISDFYSMDYVSGHVCILNDLLAAYINPEHRPEEYKVDHLANLVHRTGEIAAFIARLYEKWEKANEYLPANNQ